jgi:hypothetical protein
MLRTKLLLLIVTLLAGACANAPKVLDCASPPPLPKEIVKSADQDTKIFYEKARNLRNWFLRALDSSTH